MFNPIDSARAGLYIYVLDLVGHTVYSIVS